MVGGLFANFIALFRMPLLDQLETEASRAEDTLQVKDPFAQHVVSAMDDAPHSHVEDRESELPIELTEHTEHTDEAVLPEPEQEDVWANFTAPKVEQDRRLIVDAKAGNEKAFEQLMKRYHKSVYYLALKMVRNAEDAEDLTQESFAKAFASIGSFDPKYAFSTWLFRIATNSCIDHIRRKRLQTLSIDQGMGNDEGGGQMLQIEDQDHNPYDQYLRNQRREYLNLALARLPERYQRLIDLRYYRELSYEEVAEELALPLGTVKAQLHRARELLMGELASMEKNL
jgi:RNA polymerase sigma factor (sigma-70 family)